MDEESIKRDLLDNAMKRQWKDVMNIFEENPWLDLTVGITRAGDTALHLAILDGQEDIVEEMVMKLPDDDPPALKKGNVQGNTPLHLAAKLGNARMCCCIAGKSKKSLECLNKDGENPIFTAVLHGKMEAYRALASLPDTEGKTSGMSRKRGSGDTILHAAICGEFFELAFEIVNHYEDLVNRTNVSGETPLHVLAKKPLAFRSGTHLHWLNEIVYSCILVEKLEPTTLPTAEELGRANLKTKNGDKHDDPFPMNYQTCFMLPQLLIRTVEKYAEQAKSNNIQGDIEAPNEDEEYSCNIQGDIEDPITKKSSPNKGIGQELPKNLEQTKKNLEHVELPLNWNIIFEYIKLIYKIMLVILGKGSQGIKKMEKKKKHHTWSVQIMEKLVQYQPPPNLQSQSTGAMPPDRSPSQLMSMNQDPNAWSTGATPAQETTQKRDDGGEKIGKNEAAAIVIISRKNGGASASEVVSPDKIRELFPVGVYDRKQYKSVVLLADEYYKRIQGMTPSETPILIAAKNGITEIIERILVTFPMNIHDTNAEGKNIVHLAAEHRQPKVFNLLQKNKILNLSREAVFGKLDEKDNSVLHMAAMMTDDRAWIIPGDALQMQAELKWYKHVKSSMPEHYFSHQNKDGKTPKDILRETHKDLIKGGGEWLNNTSSSCSVVAALIATVAFATSATVPGGVNNSNGRPTLQNHPAFNVYAISSLVALCFSVTALVMFLSILTSRHQEKEFKQKTPRMLLAGLTSLFVSIAAVLLSFCAGHFFVLEENLRFVAIPVYAVTCLPVTFFAMAQFPLYFDLLTATFTSLPRRTAKSVH